MTINEEERKMLPTRKCICNWEKCHQWCKVFKNVKDTRGGVFHLYLSTKSEKSIKWSDAVLSSLGANTSIKLDKSHVVARHHWSCKQLELFDKTGPKKLYPSTPVRREVYLNSAYKFEDRWKIQPKRKYELSSKWRYFQVPNVPESFICKEIGRFEVYEETGINLLELKLGEISGNVNPNIIGEPSSTSTSLLRCPESLTEQEEIIESKGLVENMEIAYNSPSAQHDPPLVPCSPPTLPSILLQAAASLEDERSTGEDLLLLDDDTRIDRRRICICNWSKCHHYSKIFEDNNDIRAGSIQLSLTKNTDKSKEWRNAVIETLKPTTARRTLYGRNSVARLHWSARQLEYFDTMDDGPKRYPSTPVNKEIYVDTVHAFDDRWKIKYYLGNGWYYFHVPNVPESFVRQEILNRRFYLVDDKLETASAPETPDEADPIQEYSSSPSPPLPQPASDTANKTSYKTCICSWSRCFHYSKLFMENGDVRGGTMTLYLSTRSEKSKKWRDSVIECLGSVTTNKRVYNVARHHWSQKQLECFDRIENGCKRYYPSTPVTKEIFLNTVHTFDDRYKVKLQTSSEWKYFHVPNVPEDFIEQEISEFITSDNDQLMEDMPLCGFHPIPSKQNNFNDIITPIPSPNFSNAFAQLVYAASALDTDSNNTFLFQEIQQGAGS